MSRKPIAVLCAALAATLALSSCNAVQPEETDAPAIAEATTELPTEEITEPATEPVTEPVTEPIVTASHSDLAFAHQSATEQLKISADGRLKKGTLTTTMKVPESGEAGLVFALTVPNSEQYFETESGLSYYYFAVNGDKTAHLYRIENGKKAK